MRGGQKQRHLGWLDSPNSRMLVQWEQNSSEHSQPSSSLHLSPLKQPTHESNVQFSAQPLHNPAEEIVHQHGLKHLSSLVMTTLSSAHNCSYKHIANLIIKNHYPSDLSESKQQNIRRRVYDALNVLLSLKIISKHHKHICYHPKLQQPMPNAQQLTLATHLIQKQKLLQRKRQQIQDQRELLKTLQQHVQLKSQSDYPTQKISFPMVMLQGSMRNAGTKVQIALTKESKIFGDVDLIKLLYK